MLTNVVYTSEPYFINTNLSNNGVMFIIMHHRRYNACNTLDLGHDNSRKYHPMVLGKGHSIPFCPSISVHHNVIVSLLLSN